MDRRFVGYVSIPFGEKEGVDYSGIYTQAIVLAPKRVASSESTSVQLFREDEDLPELSETHEKRLVEYGIERYEAETRLRTEIQKHIILSDFVVADISNANANVMLEVGFAQALGKRVIYLTHGSSRDSPSNLGDLKRLIKYSVDNLGDLKITLWSKIMEVVGELAAAEDCEREQGGAIQYYPARKKMPLDDLLEGATEVIQILTTNLTTVSANYRDAIIKAVNRAREEGRDLKVTILTSDPSSDFIDPRAEQLGEDQQGYQSELTGSLQSVAAKLTDFEGCKILTYRDFPVQLWHRIDGMIYIGSPSVSRRSRENCVFAVPVNVPGIKETYLDHFENLAKKATLFEKREEEDPRTLKPQKPKAKPKASPEGKVRPEKGKLSK